MVCLPAMALAVLAVAADAPVPVKVNLSPSYKVGQKFHYAASMTYTMAQSKIRGDSGYAQRGFGQSFAGQLEADGEVLAVFPNGSPKKISFTVKSISANTDVDDIAGLPGAGAKITLEGGASGSLITIDDKPAVGQAGEAIGKLVFSGNEKLSELAALSPKEPVLVGATWPVANFDFLPGAKNPNAKTQASGQMKLISVTGTGDSQTVSVSGQLSISSPATTSENSTAATKYTYDLAVPATTTKGTFKETYTSSAKNTQVTAGSADEPQTEIITTIEAGKTTAINFL